MNSNAAGLDCEMEVKIGEKKNIIKLGSYLRILATEYIFLFDTLFSDFESLTEIEVFSSLSIRRYTNYHKNTIQKRNELT